MSLFEKINSRFSEKSNLLLLIFVCFFIFFIPFFPVGWHKTIGTIIFSAIFFISIFTLDTWRKQMFTVAIIALLTEWIAFWLDMPGLNLISSLTNIVFFQIIVVKLIIQIAKSKKTDSGVIFESINGYLMMGLMFTTWVAIAMLYNPNAFNFGIEDPTALDYTYFTFVTMTTLGYGEITPTLPFAKSLAILISTCGQIYVAVIIAMLVGKYAGRQNA